MRRAAERREVPSFRASVAGLAFLVSLVAGGFVLFAVIGEEIVVRYRRSGGIAGATTTLSVRTDGFVELIQGDGEQPEVRTHQVAQTEVDRLRELLEEAPWPTDDTVMGDPVPDGFRHDIVYDGVQVRAYEPLPRWLAPIVVRLNSMSSPSSSAPPATSSGSASRALAR